MPRYLKPHGHRVLVEPMDWPSDSPLVIPEIALWSRQQDPGHMHLYRVLSLGTGSTMKNGKRTVFECKPGDVILSRTHYGQDVRAGDHLMKILDYPQILAVLTQWPVNISP